MTTIKTKQPKKQRKRYFTAPYHLRNRMMTASLSHDLREKYGIRRLPVHKDDKVEVIYNKSEDQEIKGKVIKVLPQRYAIHIEGHSKEKADGTIVSFPVHPSNVIITSLNLRDKRRRDLIQRKSEKELSEEVLTEGIFDEEFDDDLEDYEALEEEEELLDEFEEFEEFEETLDAEPPKEIIEELDAEPPKEIIKEVDLSLIEGIGPKTAMILKDHGFDTVEKIAKATAEELSKTPGIGQATAEKIIKNAKDSLKSNASSKKEDEEQ
jgi:large subunit ribosomal protein L24